MQRKVKGTIPSPLRILVADDYKHWATDIARELDRWGHATDTAWTLGQVVTVVREKVFDVLLLDAWFEHATEPASSVVAEVKALQPNLKIILMSCSHPRRIEERALAWGCHAGFKKDRGTSWDDVLEDIFDAIQRVIPSA